MVLRCFGDVKSDVKKNQRLILYTGRPFWSAIFYTQKIPHFYTNHAMRDC
jgi:hypothetical protein